MKTKFLFDLNKDTKLFVLPYSLEVVRNTVKGRKRGKKEEYEAKYLFFNTGLAIVNNFKKRNIELESNIVERLLKIKTSFKEGHIIVEE